MLPIHTTPKADISYRHVGRTDVTRYEKMHVEVFGESADASVAADRRPELVATAAPLRRAAAAALEASVAAAS